MQSNKTILLIDDDVLVRIGLAGYLRACGHRVVEAAGAAEAQIILREWPSEIDIVLADAQLAGGEGGFGIAQWVRRLRPSAATWLAASLPKKIEAVEKLCNGEGPCPGDVLLQQIQNARARKRPGGFASEAKTRRFK